MFVEQRMQEKDCLMIRTSISTRKKPFLYSIWRAMNAQVSSMLPLLRYQIAPIQV